MKQRKWEYIANKLREFKAPAKVVNAAVELDNALIKLELGWNTDEWSAYPEVVCVAGLRGLVYDVLTCTACDVVNDCSECTLGGHYGQYYYCCTPRSKHADNYHHIVAGWISKSLRRKHGT